MLPFKDKKVWITGVSSGIGKSLTLLYLANGAEVIGFGRFHPEIHHEKFHFVALDFTAWSDEVMSALDAPDILINNAGVGYFGYIEDMPWEQIEALFQINILGMIRCCRMVLPGMKKNGAGHIINISSTAGLEGMPQVSAYCATKWAVRGFSESLWREVRDSGIKVTCIYPGAVKTEFFKNSPGIKAHDYMLMPEEVAEAIMEATQKTSNFHTVNLEIRPLQPKGPLK